MVMDLDSRGLMTLARDMRDKAQLPSGRPIEKTPSLFIGAADAPQEPNNGWTAAALHAKVDVLRDIL